ncbi:MAG TPA: NACHT domain-containing protein [Thermoanaerobaculia bacterium]|nr:NACHT domain-containing protein [Thermoanaerobaculia bacterium]
MPTPQNEYTIFISSPGDVEAERHAVEEIIDTINNSMFARSHNLRCRTINWKRDTASSIGESPQRAIDGQTPGYDIYLGIMSKRFGTPTGAAGSGTEHEFNSALERRTRHPAPWIMFFFRDGANLSVQELATGDALEQVKRVVEFRRRVEGLGISKSYTDLPEFRDTVRQDLEAALHRLATGQKAAEPEPDQNDAEVLAQFREAARSFTERFGNSVRRLRYVEVDSRDADGKPLGPLTNALTYIVATQRKSVVVLGEFGSGKTTFGLHYAYTLAEQWLNKPSLPLPLFFRLREYRDAEAIEDWILDQMAKKLGVNLELYTLSRFLRRQRLVAILDGLDEVAGARDDQSVRLLIRELTKLVNLGISVIVTCRTTFYESQAQSMASFEKLYIDKLSHHQVIDCARKSLPQEWESFVTSIEERFVYLSELAKRPLFLTMMIDLQQKGTLYKIKNAGDLYSEITGAWIAKESLREGATLNEHERRTIVQFLAFQMFVRERGYFELTELHEIVREMIAAREVYGIETFDVNQVIKDIKNAAFMDLDQQNRFRFAHQSFMEFFVAEKFVRELANNDTTDFGLRILYEEIYEHLALLTDSTQKRQPLLNALSSVDASFVAKVNCIPPLRKQRTPEAIPFLMAALAGDASPLLRYVCGYTLAIFQEEYRDIFSLPDNREFIRHAYETESNSLIRARLAILLSEGTHDEAWRELSPDFVFDEESVEAIVSAPGIVSAYEQVLKVRREHPAVVEESMRLLAVFVATGHDETGVALAVLTKYIFADGFCHRDERVRRMAIWVIVYLRLFGHHTLDGTQAHQIVSKALLDTSLSVRAIARWATGVMSSHGHGE